MEPEAIVQVRFNRTNEGGKRKAIGPSFENEAGVDFYGCQFVIGNEAYECRLLLEGRRLELGETYELKVKFMNPHLILPKLAVGKEFVLLEGKEVAKGKVIRLLKQ